MARRRRSPTRSVQGGAVAGAAPRATLPVFSGTALLTNALLGHSFALLQDRGPDHGGGSFRDRDRGFKVRTPLRTVPARVLCSTPSSYRALRCCASLRPPDPCPRPTSAAGAVWRAAA